MKFVISDICIYNFSNSNYRPLYNEYNFVDDSINIALFVFILFFFSHLPFSKYDVVSLNTSKTNCLIVKGSIVTNNLSLVNS